MFERFLQWHNKYETEILWFFIGLFVNEASIAFARREYVWMLVCGGIAVLNYYSWKQKR